MVSKILKDVEKNLWVDDIIKMWKTGQCLTTTVDEILQTEV